MSLSGDLRYAARGLRYQPGFAALAIVALALGIGAATSIFSVIYNVLLNPFPYRDADRIAIVHIHDVKRPQPGGRAGYMTREFMEFAHQNHVFEDAVGINNLDVLYTTPEGVERLQGAELTGNTFDFLGVAPLLGRGLEPSDGKPGGDAGFCAGLQNLDQVFQPQPGHSGQNVCP